MRDRSASNRRTVLKTLGAGIIGSVAASGSVVAGHTDNHNPARPPVTPPGFFPTWGTDETDNWELTDTSGDREEPIDGAVKPYYLIIPTELGDSPHFFGFDQVVDTPRGNGGTYNANWHAHNVFYDNPEHKHHGKHYNGKEVLTSTGQVKVTPNDAGRRTGGDDYLNTVSQIKDADKNGFANDVHHKDDVPDAGSDVFVEFTFTCPVRPRNQNGGGN